MTNNQKIAIEKSNKIFLVGLDDIVYFKADGNYTNIHTVDEECYLICRRIGVMNQKIKNINEFIRITQSIIINKNFIKYIHKKEKKIEMINNTILPFTVNLKDILNHFSINHSV